MQMSFSFRVNVVAVVFVGFICCYAILDKWLYGKYLKKFQYVQQSYCFYLDFENYVLERKQIWNYVIDSQIGNSRLNINPFCYVSIYNSLSCKIYLKKYWYEISTSISRKFPV